MLVNIVHTNFHRWTADLEKLPSSGDRITHPQWGSSIVCHVYGDAGRPVIVVTNTKEQVGASW